MSMRLSVYETMMFCETKSIAIEDCHFKYSLIIGCRTNKQRCNSFYDKVLRELCIRLELGNYKPSGLSKCYLSEYIKNNSSIFTKFINCIYNLKTDNDLCSYISDKLFERVYLDTFKNLVAKKYTEEQYKLLYSYIMGEGKKLAVFDQKTVESNESEDINDVLSQETPEELTKKEINEIILLTFYSKYHLKVINGKRYYEVNMGKSSNVLDDTIPYLFKYKDIEIHESTWKHMTLRILEEIDKMNPKEESELLSLSFWWSKTEVFSKENKTSFSRFKNLFLNTNRSSTHSLMNIQGLLTFYGINPAGCYFVIRRHHTAEPDEIRDFFRNDTINGFAKCMFFRRYEDERIRKTINNILLTNKILAKNSGFKDFFLFDDYYYFRSYKNKVIEQAKNTFFYDEKKITIIEKCLNRLDEYYKNKSFYDSITEVTISNDVKRELNDSIEYLFGSLNTSVITASKLFARMTLINSETMSSLGKFNNQEDLYLIASSFFRKKYYFAAPFISKDKDAKLENDDIIITYAYSLNEITVDIINDYTDKLHLKRLNSFLDFFIELSGEFVQVDRDRLIKKEILDLKDETLEKIKKELKYYIRSFGSIKSTSYSDYSSLPKTNIKWNEYFLLGVVRTFFNHTFKIEYSNGTYKSFDFIIDLL